jgi:hypothetical protein
VRRVRDVAHLAQARLRQASDLHHLVKQPLAISGVQPVDSPKAGRRLVKARDAVMKFLFNLPKTCHDFLQS